MAHDGKYITLDIIPTINKDDTDYKAEGQYVDSEKIRIHNGRVEGFGAYNAKTITSAFTGVARDIHIWKELRNVPHYMVGTHQKLEIEQLGTKYDITPVQTTVSANNIISTTSGATSVIVSVASHGRAVGDFIAFVSVDTSGSVGDIDLQGNQYEVTTVTDDNSYIVATASAADRTSVSYGGNVKLYHLLPTGLQSNGASYGWGAGTWNTPGVSAGAGWDDPRGGDGITAQLRQWSLDNWGEDGVANVRGGSVYYWDATTSVDVRASVIDTAPLSNNVAFVHPNRHLVLLGTWPVGTSAIDPLEIRWSDRDNPREFAVCAGTRAGTFRLQGTGNEIVGYSHSKRETVVFTDDSVWSMRPLNNDLVFGFDMLATNAGLIAQHAAVDVDGVVYWMSNRKFYHYDGRVVPMKNQVEDFVFNRIDRGATEKIFAGVNKDFQEIIWLYQSTSATDDIDSYVKYNWDTDSWDVGTFDRVVWADSGIFDYPIALNASGTPFDHEFTDDNTGNGAALKQYIESSYFDIGDGTDMMLVDQMIPDFVLSGQLNFSITVQKWPGGPEETKGPFTILPSTEKIDLRARGRQAKIKFSTSTIGTSWGIGKPRFRVRPDGER
jgi:hypothetical protein